MSPETQALLEQSKEISQQALLQLKFIGYSSYAALLVCAFFAILSFWKLRHIERVLREAHEGQSSKADSNEKVRLESSTPSLSASAAVAAR